MLVFWLSWLMVSLSFFYWFSLSSLMALNSPLSVFFFFFFFIMTKTNCCLLAWMMKLVWMM